MNRTLGAKLSAVVLATGIMACGSDDPASPSTSSPATAAAGGAPASSPATPKPAAAPDKAAPSSAAAGAKAPAAAASSISADETWSDGKMLASSVTIAPDTKVQIAPGAQISVSSGVTITVQGSLEADAKDDHAKLSGAGWMGIVVASGGSLRLRGVDIEGASETIRTNAGNADAQYDYGTITNGLFRVDAGSTFKTDHAAVIKGGFSVLGGSLKATFLDYSGAAFALGDPSANVFVADSKITGSGGDFFTANGGELLHVEYTTIDNTHCPFHFNALSKYEIDHVTTGGTGATSTDAFGLMIYNSEAGPNTISYSNFNDPMWDQSRPTTAIHVMNTFIRSIKGKPPGQVTFTPADASGNNAQTDQNADAHPRGTPGPVD